MRPLGGMGGRGGKIAAKLADILKQGAIPARHIVPELARRKALLHDDRAAANQSRADRHDAADAVIHRQAIVQAVVGADVGEPGKTNSSTSDAVMADIGAFGRPVVLNV